MKIKSRFAMWKCGLRLAVPAALSLHTAVCEPVRIDTSKLDPHIALRLRQTAARAQPSLSEPPQMLARSARAQWREFAGASSVAHLEHSRTALRDVFGRAADSWQSSQQINLNLIAEMEKAVLDAEEAVAAVRSLAVRGAAARPWSAATAGAQLVCADGSPGNAQMANLKGKTVGVYFTASWCGPCHQFSPKLVQLYKRAAETGADFEVLMVSWDKTQSDREAYAQHCNMEWKALPHDQGELIDELGLRYDVRGIPWLVVLKISEDGRTASVLSNDGRMDVERGCAEWMSQILESPIRL